MGFEGGGSKACNCTILPWMNFSKGIYSAMDSIFKRVKEILEGYKGSFLLNFIAISVAYGKG